MVNSTMVEADFLMLSVRLEPRDVEVLDALTETERLSRSDVVRRALRSYAQKLEALPKPSPKRPKPK